ncbi:hypothetical protein QBC47DRAFT_394619 [Echria macrotheca]|uniref:Uncharacterized protein n=1 Tax=Echria macrotheca TaxID=438768 RepID=A0AAJ0B1T1_9PEZI|nr:hypothetical protein QBC47DRAFT_394619 [Echria macrotheca]
MPALHFPDGNDLMRGLIHTRQALVRREIDHTAVETIAVLLTIFISMGLFMYWGIVKQGSCNWRK